MAETVLKVAQRIASFATLDHDFVDIVLKNINFTTTFCSHSWSKSQITKANYFDAQTGVSFEITASWSVPSTSADSGFGASN